MQNVNPNEVTLQPMLWRHLLLCIYFKLAHAVGCLKLIALNEEMGKWVLVVLWGHNESF